MSSANPTTPTTPEKHGRLTVISRTSRKWRTYYLCRCDCGRETEVEGGNLRSGHTQSCGCLQPENIHHTHGHTRGGGYSKVYVAWMGMRDRCSNPKNRAYAGYGGRGIRVCDRWLNSFEAFLADMGEPPDRTTLDRIDNAGNYEPGNCRWATMKEQGRNKRNNRLLTHDGRTQTLSAWAEETGMGMKRIHSRLKLGWSVERALTEKPNPLRVAAGKRAGGCNNG